MRRVLVGAAFLSLLGSGCSDVFAVKETQNTPIILRQEKKTDSVSSPSLGETGATGTQPVFKTPPLKPGEIASASGNVVVASIVPNQALSSPFVILGRARVFESAVNWRVRDKNGVELASGVTLADARDMGIFGQFRIRAFLRRVPSAATGRVEVFSISPRDGAEENLVSVPVKLSLAASAVKVFFSNVLKDPQTAKCEVVYPFTHRVPKTANAAEASLLELLDGPTAAEQAVGARTAIMPGARLLSIALDGETAAADFSRELIFGLADACLKRALTSQIEQTLKQFPNIKTVKIKVEGQAADDLLKP